jgi:enoyl-CoA hydratase
MDTQHNDEVAVDRPNDYRARLDYEGLETVTIDIADRIATLTLNRPESRNASTPEMFRDLIRCFVSLRDDPRVGVIILTGAGKDFSAGGDLTRLQSQSHVESVLDRLPEHRALRLVDSILSVPQPLIAAVNGNAIGWGLALAMWADLTVVAEDALIGDPHVKLGLVPPSSVPMFEFNVGTARARRMLLMAELISGTEAAAWGLVAMAVPRAEVLAEARRRAAAFLELPPLAVNWTKRLLNARVHREVHGLLEQAAAFEGLTMITKDSVEAVDAWVEGRKPVYTGH